VVPGSDSWGLFSRSAAKVEKDPENTSARVNFDPVLDSSGWKACPTPRSRILSADVTAVTLKRVFVHAIEALISDIIWNRESILLLRNHDASYRKERTGEISYF
jgi:hypothetical protein